MTNTPTAHNSAKASDFAKTVLMPARQVTAVRSRARFPLWAQVWACHPDIIW